MSFPDDFYGFREVPFHVHLGMRFERPDPDGPAVVTLPAQRHLLGHDGRQSTAAAYTVGEVAAGIAVCDALLLHATPDAALMPLVLTRRAEFTPGPRPRGDIRSRASFAGDAAAAADGLRRSRKAKVAVECALSADGDEPAGHVTVHFYVRLMDPRRLEAMAGPLMPALAERARAALALRGAER
jgi:acyl-coenzyme A thioesterase PaaI-like protein